MQTFIYQSKTISYLKQGAGFPVVLLHGFAEDSEVWLYQYSFLKDYCTLIIPDLPGSGHSQLLEKAEGDLTMEDYADCIYVLLQAEGIESCIVLGHSMGGYIALALVEKYPHLISGFGFVHSTAFADSGEKKAMRLKAINTIEQYGSYAFIKSTTPNLFTDEYKATNAGEVESLVSKGNSFSKAALQQYYKAMMLRKDKSFVLKNSSVPVLFIIGEEDKAAPLADALQQAHMPYIAYIHILANVGHMAMWEKKEEVNKCLLEFIQDIISARRFANREIVVCQST